ncbi:MAG: hypothetical protein WD737_00880 [Gemmatimonadota bacterium]
MHDILRERLWRNLEALPEERLYQVLDYIEFLGSKYARDGVRPPGSPLQKFGERLEDRMRLNGVGLSVIRGTIGAMGTADRVVQDLAQAGQSLLRDVEAGLRPPLDQGERPPSEPRERPPLPRVEGENGK